jgi:hypothetical protein
MILITASKCEIIQKCSVIEKPRAGNLAIQGEEEARCCSTYRLTISNVAPPVEAAK